MEKVTTFTPKTVQQLLDGSRRLNEMNGEIHRVISMVLGLLTHGDAGGIPINTTIRTFETPRLNWTIERTASGSLIVVAQAPELRDSGIVYHSDSKREVALERAFIPSIHQGLPFLLNHLVEIFPVLHDRLKLFMEVPLQ